MGVRQSFEDTIVRMWEGHCSVNGKMVKVADFIRIDKQIRSGPIEENVIFQTNDAKSGGIWIF